MVNSQNEPCGVIFDVDGTMVDNAPWHERAWLEVCAEHGLPMTSEYYYQMHGQSNARIVQGLTSSPVTPEFVAAISLAKERRYRALYASVCTEIPGLRTLLYRLREAGIPCAAVSNSPPENVDMVLDVLQIRDYFRAVFPWDGRFPAKPDPAMLFAAAQAMQVAPGRCLVFEDSVSGFRAARNAGMPFVQVLSHGGHPVSDPELRPCAVLTDFQEVTPERIRLWVTSYAVEVAEGSEAVGKPTPAVQPAQ